jgi:hypothetical protein
MLNEIRSISELYGIKISEEVLRSKGIISMSIISEGTTRPRLSVKEKNHETIIDGKDNIILYLKSNFM